MSTDFDAIVIGAGFAGVTATRELEASGRRTLLLEARDRLGGRVFTDSEGLLGVPLELGGAYVHWHQPHVWAEITRYGLPIEEDPAPEVCLLPAGDGLDRFDIAEAFGRLAELLERFFEGSREYLERPFSDPLMHADVLRDIDRRSLSDRMAELQFSDEERRWISGMWCTLAGQSAAEGGFLTAARWWSVCGWNMAQFWDIVSRYRISSGTVELLNAMLGAGDAELRLNTPATQVTDRAGVVHVRTRDGECFTAKVAVVALPVNVWPTVEFSPELPVPKRAVAREGIGCPGGAKVWVHVRTDMPRLYAQPPEGYPFNVIWTYGQLEEGQLLACLSGDPAFQPNEAEVNDALRQVLPDAEIVSFKAHDWVGDEFSMGGWAYYKPGQITRYLKELQQPHGRLVFATGDIANGWSGSIDGAIESGLSAARVARAIEEQ